LISDTSSDGTEMKKGVFGVINNIIILYSDAKTNEYVDIMTHHIYEEVKKTCCRVAIKNLAGINEPTIDIKVIERKLHQILKEAWTLDNILAEVKPIHLSIAEKTKGPDFNLGRKKVALHFQVKIPKI
jgi:hypothetical protein